MTYRASEPKFLWLVLFILTITYAYALDSTMITYLAYVLAFVFFAAMTATYQIEIREHELYRIVTVLGIALIKQTIKADTIEKIDVIKVGGRFIILMHVKQKMRMKLQRYSPDDFTDQLLAFAEAHNIKVVKNGNHL